MKIFYPVVESMHKYICSKNRIGKLIFAGGWNNKSGIDYLDILFLLLSAPWR